MLRNYIKVALRNLLKYKGYTLLNISGLSFGLSAFYLILIFVVNEWSYDKHFSDSERIHRLYSIIKTSNGSQTTAQSPSGWARHFIADFPEVDQVTRLKPPNQWWQVVYDKTIYYEKNWTFADSSVFGVFDVQLLKGSEFNALNKPYQVVLSERMARKYFKNEEPVGQFFKLDNQYDFVVTGVFKNLPSNTHFEADFLASFVTLKDPIYGGDFLLEDAAPNVYTYVKLKEEHGVADFEAKLPALIEQYVGPSETLALSGFNVKSALQPIENIHLDSHFENEIQANGQMGTIFIFASIAVFVLLIAGINFMNLSTARSLRRAREVGLRKAIGAQKFQLVIQFIGEAVIIVFLAMCLSLLVDVLVLPQFSYLTQKQFLIDSVFDPISLSLLLGCSILIALLSGLYPAFYLSAFSAVAVLKGDLSTSGKVSGMVRKVLLVFQFTVSMVILIATSVLYNQLDFIENLDLGLDEEKVVVAQLTDPVMRAKYKGFKLRAELIPEVTAVSASFSAPADLVNQGFFRPESALQEEKWLSNFFGVDFDFFETLGVDMVAGRSFSMDFPSDTLQGVVINQTAVQQFGFESDAAAIGKKIFADNSGNNNPPLEVIGVSKDFHLKSVHDKIAPTVIMYWNVQAYFFTYIRTDNPSAKTVQSLEVAWNEIMENYPFQYAYLDDKFELLYVSEHILKDLLGYFAILTIIIAGLGLYGLSSYMVEQRRKEVGIRKVLGASDGVIAFLLTYEYTLLILLSFFLACPLAYYGLSAWLNSFEYHSQLNLLDFILPFVLTLLVSWLTIGFQVYKATKDDPIHALRTE